jgi:large subunit ribosomal protein L10
MDDPRPEKVAVVDEVRERFTSSEAALLTEYRGIDVHDMQTLRRSLRAVGGDYKIYKNTLVRFAVRELGLEIEDLLTGPTAIAFVPTDGSGDPVTVAKALRDFAKGNPHLVVKGGVLGEDILSEADAKALAEIAPREELLAQLAGLMAAPMQQFAGLLQAVPRDFAYGLRALIDQGGAPGAPVADPPASGAPAETTTEEAPSTPEAETARAQTDQDQTDQHQTEEVESAEAPSDAPATDAPATDVAADAQEQES